MGHYCDGAPLATDLVNTLDLHASEDSLGTVEALVEFAADHGIYAGPATESELHRLGVARSLLRTAMLADDPNAAVTSLNDVLATARPRPRLVRVEDSEWVFLYGNPEAGLVDQLLAEAAGQVLREIRDHGPDRFATCASSTCEDVFVDQSRNHSRRYCTPDICGNREAQRAYRTRRAEPAGD